MKKIMMLLITACTVLASSGCSENGKQLLDGFVKNTELKNYTETQNISIDINSDFGKNEYSSFNVQSFFNALSDFNLSSVSVMNEKDGVTKGKSEISISAPDCDIRFNLYQDGDSVTAYIPTLIRSFLPYEYEDARYVEFNTVNADVMGAAKKFAPEMVKSFIRFGEYIDDGNTISKSGNKYTMTMTDENVKNIIKGIVSEYYSNPEFQADVESAVFLTATYVNGVSGEDGSDIPTEIPEFTEEAYNTAMADMERIFEEIRIIGDDGIKIEFTSDNKGYITAMDFDGTFIAGNRFTGSNQEVSVTLKYDWKLDNINVYQDVEIPQFSKENRIGIKEWTELNTPIYPEYEDPYNEGNPDYRYNVTSPAEDGSITFFDIYDMRVKFDIAPVVKDGVTYVADSEITKLLPWARLVTEPFETGYRLSVGYDYRDNILVYPDDNKMYQRDYIITVKNAPFVENGVLYLPLKDFIDIAYDIEVGWNENIRAVYVHY